MKEAAWLVIGTAGAKSGSRTCYAASFHVLIIFYAVKNGPHQTMNDPQLQCAR